MSKSTYQAVSKIYETHRETLGVRASIDATAKELKKSFEETATQLGFTGSILKDFLQAESKNR